MLVTNPKEISLPEVEALAALDAEELKLQAETAARNNDAKISGERGRKRARRKRN